MPWELFESQAAGYETWYAGRRGRRVSQAEQGLLSRLLAVFPTARRVVEVGCGTGHFARWMAGRFPRVVGLERSPSMLATVAAVPPALPVVLGDAHALPFRDQSLDLAVFVTALEFLEDPAQGLAEAVRVARQGLVLVVLNRWSPGGLSRRWGSQSRKPILGWAHDYALPALRAAVSSAAGRRLRRLTWRAAVFPGPLWRLQAPIPLGEVLGVAAALNGRDGRTP